MVQPCVVRRWSREVVGELLAAMPQVRINLMREMAMHMNDALTRVRELTTARVDQRLAQTLLRLARQCGQPEGDGVLITQPLTRQELADLTGTTFYTVSRTLAKWESQGLLASRKRQLLLNRSRASRRRRSATTSESRGGAVRVFVRTPLPTTPWSEVQTASRPRGADREHHHRPGRHHAGEPESAVREPPAHQRDQRRCRPAPSAPG